MKTRITGIELHSIGAKPPMGVLIEDKTGELYRKIKEMLERGDLIFVRKPEKTMVDVAQ